MPALTVRLLINASTHYGRNLVRGVSRYVQEHEHWTLLFEPLVFEGTRVTANLKQADGMIARVWSPRVGRHVEACGLKTINVSEDEAGAGLPRVINDHEAIGEMAAAHLQGCGFRRFAFCGYHGKAYSKARQDAFTRWCAERDLPCEVYLSKDTTSRPLSDELETLADWLRGLEHPTGVFAASDWRGHHILLASAIAGVAVPQDIGVVGVDNDDVVCDIAPTPLTSIDPHGVQVGYRAAELLHAWIAEGVEPPREEVCRDVTINRRRSTDVLLVEDEVVRAALDRMRPKGRLPHTIDEVLRHLPISRRPFERRFLQAVGMTPHAALSQIRLERMADLLANTNLPISEVAHRCGFNYGHHMASIFRNAKGMTPGEYRQRYGKRGGC